MQPIGNKVIVKPIEEENISKGGLILVEKKNTTTSEVIEVSPDIQFLTEKTTLKPGQKVIHPAGAGEGIEIDGVVMRIMNHNEIWLIL